MPVFGEISAVVSELRELSPLADTNLRFLPPTEFADWLEEQFVEGAAEELAIDKAVLVTLDMIEPDFDLVSFIIELTKGDTMGAFDHEANEMVIRGDLQHIDIEEKIALAHEYAHNLQHQHFDIGTLPLDVQDNSDISMATLSLLEGDATLISFLYAMEYIGIAEWAEVDPTGDERLESAPLVIAANYLFPYIVGMEFVGQLYLEGGWDAVNQAYANPPQSTEQLIHVDKYLGHDEPQEVVMPDLQSALGGEWSQLDTDVLGELNVRLYIQTFLDNATAGAAAEGWDGDRYVYWEDLDRRGLLVMQSVWDTDEDAEEFFSAYIDLVDTKSLGTWDLTLSERGKKWWNDQKTSIYLSRSGDDVLLIIAPDETTVESILPHFATY
ncbi:MAG: hypothetical protein JSW38_08820 [Dehalococcoidia bacterium]|nr:MAG: hypothetical protein JSV02_07525 [Dehalococcoidia bacterium]UCG82296.1 MAG: hypothetical protein JSW38_08820 [Dehalococcoidia bacterium]